MINQTSAGRSNLSQVAQRRVLIGDWGFIREWETIYFCNLDNPKACKVQTVNLNEKSKREPLDLHVNQSILTKEKKNCFQFKTKQDIINYTSQIWEHFYGKH